VAQVAVCSQINTKHINTVWAECKILDWGYKNQSVYAVSGTSRCLFSDKYKTHKY